MKILGWLNCWAVCPAAWREFLFRPIRVWRYPGWITIEVLGFAVFIERRGRADDNHGRPG